MITDLNPVSLYIYREGIARFCSEKYNPPNLLNTNRYSHFTSTKLNLCNINPTNPYIIQQISEVIKQITKNETEYNNLWNKIKDISKKVILSLIPSIISSVQKACETNDEIFKDQNLITIAPTHRFLHLAVLGLVIDENMNPYVIELLDNPSMKAINPLDEKIKSEIIKDEIFLIDNKIKNDDDEIGNWEKILPNNNELTKIDEENFEEVEEE